ncbi:MAG TPA: exopolysaccharide biosynthesis protein, partial [Candidatus Saccharimonadales bacterium]|nr:exopolysaccharide biosynthesis protein [Candidatus Saccharimonadales bacterium]
LRLVEKLVKPRRTPWMSSRAARVGNSLLVAVMGLFLAAPFPPVPPLTNALPCYAIILLAASMMEEDGVTIWFAYAISLGTIIYLVAIVEVLKEVLVHGYHALRRWMAQ